MAAVAKAALKAAKAALDSQNYGEAVSQAKTVLEADPKNYYGNVFLGRAQEKQGKAEDALKAYSAASKLKPEDELAWKGLCAVCESQGSQLISEYISAAVGLAQVYADKSDHHQSQTVIDKLVAFVKANGSRSQYKQVLRVLLPDSPIYDFLQGRLQPASLTYTRIAEITESEESERINKEIGERRTRLGAKIGQVKTEVAREVYGASELEELYEKIIDWSSDDDIRREYEEKLLRRAYDHLLVLAPQDKAKKREQVVKLAKEMVIIKHPYRLAWDLELEWQDVPDIAAVDKNILLEFVLFFPESGLAKVIQGYNGFTIKAKTKSDKAEDDGEGADDSNTKQTAEEQTKLNTEERLLMLADGLDSAKDSQLAHRMTSEHYLQIEEYQSCEETARRGLALVSQESSKSGLRLSETTDAIKSCLATSLVYYQSPKNHPEAHTMFNEILKNKPNSTAALLGIGLIYEEQEQYADAASFLERASQRDPENIRIGAEASWCRAQMGDFETGLEQLQQYLAQVNEAKAPSLDLKALLSYRVGKLMWTLRKDKSSRKDRKGAYAYFIASIRANPNLAPPYTGLGLYYADYAKDKKRARQCFQKAFELSGTEVKAAERLARSFADDAEWDIVELVAQRVIDSGAVKPAPGSKKRGVSWPFAAMGVVLMNKQEYPRAVVSFQAALRISAHDYNSWVGLGESYHSSGRYNAAKKALEHAMSLREALPEGSVSGAWFADYMLANVHRELGEHEEAIKGYRNVLEQRPSEFGVSIALLQTLIEQAQQFLDTGFFGQAARHAADAIRAAEAMEKSYHSAFNFWKAAGDACTIFSWIPGRINELPVDVLLRLLSTDSLPEDHSLSSVDKSFNTQTEDQENPLMLSLNAAVKSHRNSIAVSKDDFHALAVGWYNVGWTQLRKSMLQSDQDKKTAKLSNKLAVQSFKRAIELEAGNAEFWNALGVATTELSPKIAQHSFVRSLHVNERSARTWTNLGALYLQQNDHELAHQAFSRAQSTDPEYAFAWLGEGTIALLLGDSREAISHFTHATEIADSSAFGIKSQYLSAVFDRIVATADTGSDLAALVLPVFNAQQLQSLALSVTPFRHLLALLQERMGEYSAAVSLLQQACDAAESVYETEESPEALAQYIRAKGDLARNQLAVKSFEEAAENAEMVLDLSADEDASSMGLDAEDRTRCRLSAHMTAGLARYHLQAIDEAIAMFRAALDEADGAADIVCLLAQMLWASQGKEQRNVAKEQLFDTLERHSGHVGATTLLGAIALIEDDEETLEAVTDDLQGMRTDDSLTQQQQAQIERLLNDAATLSSTKTGDLVANAEVYRSIMLHPASPSAWAALASATGDEYAGEFAARTAQGGVPPRGALEADDLAAAFAQTGGAGDAQRAIMAAPWASVGWQSLAEAVSCAP